MRANVERPLEGRSILVTRPAERAQELVRRLEALGARVEARPTIALEPPRNHEPVRAAIRRLGRYDWLLFTSPSGVEYFFLKDVSQQSKCTLYFFVDFLFYLS